MKMTKKVLSILLSLMLVLGAVSVGGVSASAELSENAELLIDDNPAIYDGRIVLREGTGWSIAVNGNSVTLNLDNLDLTCGGNCIDARYLDLKITGSAKLTSTSRVIYIDKGNLTLNGDFTLRGQDEHGCALNIDDSLTVEGGSLSVINTGNDGAIILLSTMWVKGGSVYAKTESSSYRAISGEIILNNGEAFALGDEDAKEVLIRVPGTLAGKGTEDSPYMICDYTDLKTLASKVNGGETAACAKLMNNIDASASAETNDWTPIGYYNSGTDNNPFIGTFDGDGHVITGLTTPEGYGSFAGLFGYVGEGGTVQNVGLEDGSITGNNYVGGVVGNNFGTVENCYNKGAVSGADCVGGVVGLSDGTVTNCYNTGNVSGSDDVGGVVGFIRFERTVTNCYNTGNITATDDYANVGGIAGVISRNSTVTNCYSTGNITATGDSADVGGVAGFVITEGKTINCYYDKTICGEIGAIDGADSETAKGLTTAEMTGIDALSDSNMKFIFESGETNPWLTKADGAEADGGYYWYYPHLKGFAYDRTSAAEDWPAKVEITVALSDGNSCTYDGDKHGVYVTIGDTSIPEGTIVTYSKYGSTWGTESEITPTDPGNYRMTIRNSSDEVVETKYFTILEQATDYTVSYYKKTGDGWSSESVDPVDAGEYKAVLTFTDTGHNNIEKELTIDRVDVTVTAASEEFTYDGTAHSNNNYEVDGLVGSDAITAVVTGRITYPSDSPVDNVVESYEFTSGSPDNYNVTTVNGELTMSNASVAITITSASGDWIYDGNAHSDNTVKVTSGELLTGDTLVATATGSVTDVSDTATGNNQIAEGYKIMHGDVDVTANYTITAVNGTLTIKPASATVAITGHNNTTPYDGEEHTVSGYDVAISNPLYTESDFRFSGNAEAKRTDAGTTNMGLNADQFTNINPNFNVIFNVTDGHQEIIAINVYVSVKGNSATEDYDGSEKSVTGYTATASNNLYDVENDIEFSGTAEAKRTEPGNESMGLDASQFSNKNANFNATFTVEEDGKLTVNPVIKFANEDGTELQSGAVAYGEAPEYKGETPAKAASDGNTYEFAGWSPEITEATANATYTATYKSNAIGLALGEIEDSTGYKEDQTFTVDTSSLPEGAEIHWFVNGEDVGTGESYTVEEPTDDYTIQAKVVDKDGNTLDETQVQAVKVRNGFMDKLKWFFSDFWNNIFKAVIDAIIKAC